jgi:hypothetical protein
MFAWITTRQGSLFTPLSGLSSFAVQTSIGPATKRPMMNCEQSPPGCQRSDPPNSGSSDTTRFCATEPVPSFPHSPILGAFILFMFRGYESLARRAIARIYRDFDLANSVRDGDVLIVFHTYHGFIAWFTQTEHRVFVSAADANRLLNRFLRFNLTWGLFTWGALFGVPDPVRPHWRPRLILTAITWAAFLIFAHQRLGRLDMIPVR